MPVRRILTSYVERLFLHLAGSLIFSVSQGAA